MTNDQLCLALASAETEEKVSSIIEDHPVLRKKENWVHYGQAANNIGTVTGQSAKSVPSLIEKITNSIDALLIKKCKMHGDDPRGHDSPRSMEEALQKYFNLTDESYANLSDRERRNLAADIQIIVQGSKKKPNIVIYDNGEGQNPQDFPKTFVSLNQGNKANVFFVQGKYNMGGTAVLPFCGEKRYQLIISKRNLNGAGDDGAYGFTLVRRNRGDENDKVSWFEYCVDSDKKILEFISKPVDLGLENRKFEGGTYIKLYHYDLRRASDATLDLWRDLNRYLYKAALPILICERRFTKGHSPTKIMHGNRTRVLLDGKESLKKTFKMSVSSDGTKYNVEVFVFNKEVSADEFIDDMAVVFTVNGQVQHSLNNSFITSKAKKAYLKGHILVNVDCSNMPRTLHEDIFMSSRDNMRDREEYRNLVETVARELRDDEYLTALDEEWRRDQIYQNPKDEEFLRKIMGKLLSDDAEIKKLLGLQGGLLSNEIKKIKKQKDKSGEEVFKGKRYPSIFKFKNLHPGNIKMLPQNGECKIEIGTDVEDEYLIRPHDKGELKVRVRKPHIRTGVGEIEPGSDDEEILDVNVVGPNEGNIKLRIRPNVTIPVGTVIPIDIEMSSPGGSFSLIAEVKIDNPQEKRTEREYDAKKEYSLPKLTEVYRRKKEEDKDSSRRKFWEDEDYNWTELDICKIHESSGEESLVDAVSVNMEPRELDNYIRSRKITGENIARITRTYKTAVYLISLVMYYEFNQRLRLEEGQEQSNSGVNYEPAEMTSFLMKGLAKILLHITTNESLIKELEASENETG